MKRLAILLALLTIATPVALPLFLSGRYYFSDDGFLHLFRVFAFDRALKEGVIYPRWLPEFASGYGLPVLNYYAPLVYYVTEMLHLLGFSIPDAIRVMCALAVFIAAGGAYFLGVEFYRGHPSRIQAGILTSVAFVFFPYFLIDIYARGAFAETLAIAVLPWFVWAWLRTITRPGNGSILVCALAFSTLMLSHNMVVYFSLPIVGALLLWELITLPESRWGAIVRPFIAIFLGLGLTAIYWLPSLAELQSVFLGRDIQRGTALYAEDFFPLKNVIQFSFPYDYVDHPFPLSVAPIVLGLVVVCAAFATSRDKKLRGRLLIFTAVVVVTPFLFSDITIPLWQSVPMLGGIQFPWRLSIFVGLSVALMIGSVVSINLTWLSERYRVGALSSKNWQRILGAGIIVLIVGILIWNGIEKLSVRRSYGPPGELTVGQIARNEINMGLQGFSVQREYLPSTVQLLPKRVDSPQNTGATPNIELKEFGSGRKSFAIETNVPMSITLRSFYFPSWQATVDGQRRVVYPSLPMGLLTLDVPSGVHQFSFFSEDTLPQRFGGIFTVIGILIVAVWLVHLIRRGEQDWQIATGFLGLLVSVALLPICVALTAALPMWQPVRVDVSPELRLIGWRIEHADLRQSAWNVTGEPGSLELGIIWQVKQALRDEPFVWRLVDANGQVVSQRTQLARYGSGLAATWVPNEIVEDHYSLMLNQLASGKYQIETAFAGGAFTPIGWVNLDREIAVARAPVIAHEMDARVGADIRFLGYNAPAVAYPGDTLPVTLFWKSERHTFEDQTVFVQLLDGNGKRVAQRDSFTDGIYPMTLWTPGVIVTDRRDVWLPRDLEPGLYQLIAGLYRNPSNPERLPVVTEAGPSPDDVIVLGAIKIPTRAVNLNPRRRLNISFGSTMRLFGVDQENSANQLMLKLYWQAQKNVGTDYKVFIHVVDDAGNLVAQQDRIPNDGKYPTRIWDSGEQISDAYQFPLKTMRAGNYRILVGMYSPDTGERVLLLDSNGKELADRQVQVGTFEVTSP